MGNVFFGRKLKIRQPTTGDPSTWNILDDSFSSWDTNIMGGTVRLIDEKLFLTCQNGGRSAAYKKNVLSGRNNFTIELKVMITDLQWGGVFLSANNNSKVIHVSLSDIEQNKWQIFRLTVINDNIQVYRKDVGLIDSVSVSESNDIQQMGEVRIGCVSKLIKYTYDNFKKPKNEMQVIFEYCKIASGAYGF